MLLIILKHRVETEVVHHLFPAKPDDQSAFLRLLNVVGLQQILKQAFIFFRLNSTESWQSQYRPCQLGRLSLADAFEGTHRLVVEDTDRLFPQLQRLYPSFTNIQFDDRNCPEQCPRHPCRQLRFLVLFLRAKEHHF
ncbi:hypothetical protein D3C74_292740 [compost metagenome]